MRLTNSLYDHSLYQIVTRVNGKDLWVSGTYTLKDAQVKLRNLRRAQSDLDHVLVKFG